MKKVKNLLVMLLLVFIVLFTVNAEGESGTEVAKKEITVYMFRGEGCGFCEKALTFFESIEGEYGKYFELVTYEVWNNATNQALMQDVGVYLNKQITGVPFIIIGEKTFGGFQESWGDQIKEAIMTEYNKSEEDRVDIIEKAKRKETNGVDNDVVISVITLAIVVGGAVFVYYARRGNEAEVVLEEKIIEEVQVEKVKKESIKSTKNKKSEEEVKIPSKKESTSVKKSNKKTSENKDNKKPTTTKVKTQKQKK